MAFGDIEPKALGGTTITALVSTGDDELTLRTAAPITGGDTVQIQFTANGVPYDVETAQADMSGDYIATATDIRTNLAAEEGNRIPVTLTVVELPTPPFLADAVVWLDPTDNSKMWQDTGKTTPVTADGDPIAVWEDSNGGGDWVQSDNARRPTWKTTYVQFSDDWLVGPDLTTDLTTEGTFMAAVHVVDSGGSAAGGMFHFSSQNSSQSAAHWGTIGLNYISILSSSRTSINWNTTPEMTGLTALVYGVQNTTTASTFVVSVDDVDTLPQTRTFQAPNAPVIGGTRRLSNISSWTVPDGRLYGLVVYDQSLSSTDRTTAFNYMNDLLP